MNAPSPGPTVLLAFCVAGTLLPLSAFVPWVLAFGPDVPRFFADLFANGVAAFFAWDVVVSALVVLYLVGTEGQRLGVRPLWAPVAATFCVGVSLGLPLYLLLRERARRGARGAGSAPLRRPSGAASGDGS